MNLNITPPILTDRLLLVKADIQYVNETYVNWLNDKQLMQYSEQRHTYHTYEGCEEYIKSFEDTPHKMWHILFKTTMEVIGSINYYYDMKDNIADIGILIGKEYQTRGFGLEAFRSVLDFLTKNGVRKITTGTLSTNLAMIKIAESCGMKKDGVRVWHHKNNTEYTKYDDILYFAMFN